VRPAGRAGAGGGTLWSWGQRAALLHPPWAAAGRLGALLWTAGACSPGPGAACAAPPLTFWAPSDCPGPPCLSPPAPPPSPRPTQVRQAVAHGPGVSLADEEGGSNPGQTPGQTAVGRQSGRCLTEGRAAVEAPRPPAPRPPPAASQPAPSPRLPTAILPPPPPPPKKTLPPQGVANYVILRPLCTVIALVTDHFGLYGRGQLGLRNSYPYLAFATNCSQVRGRRVWQLRGRRAVQKGSGGGGSWLGLCNAYPYLAFRHRLLAGGVGLGIGGRRGNCCGAGHGVGCGATRRGLPLAAQSLPCPGPLTGATSTPGLQPPPPDVGPLLPRHVLPGF
jgi:hypothetical protein